MSAHDPSLPLPRLPGAPPALELHDPELARAGRAGEGTVAVEGARAVARVEERGPVQEIRLDGRTAAGALRVDAGVSVNVVASPGLLRRERVAGGASWSETVLAPPRLPLVAVQLGPGPGSPAGVPVRGSAVLLPGAAGVRWNAGEGVVAAADPGDPEGGVVLWVGPGGSAEVLAAAEGGGLRVDFSAVAGPDAPATVVIGRSPGHGGDPLRAVPHLAGHLRAAAAGPAGGVRLDTGVPDLDDGLAWARARVAAACHRSAVPTWAAFWTGLGALAGGDAEAAERLADRLLDGASAGTGAPGDGTEEPRHAELALPAGALGPLLAARLALATGVTGPALRALAALEEREGAAAGGGRLDSSLRALALRTLADALRWRVGEERAEALRRRADAEVARAGGGPGAEGGMRLPVVGGGSSREPADTSLALLDPGRGRPPVRPGSPLEAWARLERGGAEEGYAAWRSALDAGLAEGGAGRGAWDPAGSMAPRAGVLVCAVVHGLLGWRPDAPVGRARLGPVLPARLTRFRATGLRVGEAGMEMAFHREGRDHCFRLEPTAGRAPPTLVFEPTVAAPGVDAVQVDGREVELDLREGPGGIVVPVQLPLDGPRTVRITARE